MLRRDAAAGGAARLRRLKLLPVRDSAADLIDHLAQRSAHRDFHKAGVVDFSAKREHLCALALFGTHRCKPFCPVEDNLANVGIGFHVVEQRWFAEQPLHRRERGARAGFTAAAFDGGKQRGFFSADKRAAAKAQVDIELEAGSHDVVAQKAIFPRLADCHAQAFHGNGVFRADVDIALLRADGIPCDGHGFQHGMRVAFQHGTIHECAGVAFVRIAANVFHIAFRRFRKLPF